MKLEAAAALRVAEIGGEGATKLSNFPHLALRHQPVTAPEPIVNLPS